MTFINTDFLDRLFFNNKQALFEIDKSKNIIRFNTSAKKFVPKADIGLNLPKLICGLKSFCGSCPLTAESDNSRADENALCAFAEHEVLSFSYKNSEHIISVWNFTKDSPKGIIPGIDFKTVMINYGHTIDAFTDVLTVYCNVGKEKNDLIRKYYSDKDYTNLRIEIHGLKGTSYSVGAGKLGDHAKKLEFVCRDIEAGKTDKIQELDDDLENLLGEYVKLIEDIKPYINSSEDSASEVNDTGAEVSEESKTVSDEIRNLKETIIDRLHCFEMDEVTELLKELANAVKGTPCAVTVKKATQAFEQFDYDKTELILNKL